MIAALLLLLTLPVDAQRMTGSAFCICPSGKRGHIQSPNTCEAFCDDGSQRGFHAPQHDPYEQQRRDQEAQERARRIREDAERAARAEREKLEKERRFQKDKREALGQLKGVTVAEPQLKGVGGDSGGLKGLKGLDTPKSELKGVEDAAGAGAKCVPSASCSEALDKQAAALEGARKEQADLYMAMGTADMKHGWSMKGELSKQPPPDAPSYFVWKNSDQAGYPLYLRDYKTTVDGISAHITGQRAAALSGKYDPKLKNLAQSKEARETARDAFKRLQKLKKDAEKLSAFQKYMRDLMACADGPDAQWNACASKVRKLHETALGDLPIDKATKARVKAAGDAYTKYAGRALERAKDAADSASRCYSDCR